MISKIWKHNDTNETESQIIGIITEKLFQVTK